MPPAGFHYGAAAVLRAALGACGRHNALNQPWQIGDAARWGFNTGTAAIRHVLEVMARLEPGRKNVVVPAYTCYSVAAAVERAGLRLVLCDVHPLTLDHDPAMLTRLVDGDTLCIVVAHLFGAPVDLRGARALANDRGGYVLEDAAQGGDEAAGLALADVRIYSTARGKPVSTWGGGHVACASDPLVVTLSDEYRGVPEAGWQESLNGIVGALASDVLSHPALYWIPAGLPFLRLGQTAYPERVEVRRIPRFQQALLRCVSSRTQTVRDGRRETSRFYASRLGARDRERQPRCTFEPDFAPSRFPYLLRRSIASMSAGTLDRARRLGVTPMYPAALPALGRIRACWVNPDDGFPGAGTIADRLVTLPTHERVGPRDRAAVVDLVGELEA